MKKYASITRILFANVCLSDINKKSYFIAISMRNGINKR